MDSLARRKAALRARMQKVRAAMLPQERAAASERVQARLFDLPAVRSAHCVLSFSSFGSEASTARITRRLHDEGRRVFLPFVEGTKLEGAEVRPGDPLVDSTYGPREPATRIPVDPLEVEVVLVPGLAFDRLGYRIGYGGGHYDRFLARLSPGALRVGLAFQAQLVPAVPHGPEDEPLDVVVTDEETIDCGQERRAAGPRG